MNTGSHSAHRPRSAATRDANHAATGGTGSIDREQGA